jgi:CRISPR/Cas system CSM-associated protein Csm2 small subunit
MPKKKKYDIKKIITIQSLIRGYLTRKKLRNKKDKMSLEIINEMLDKYNDNLKFITKINKLLSKKKCRNENFPSAISENIVKFAIFKKYKVMPCRDTKCGDLELLNKKIEVKGFMSDGPSSFGPKENWNWIYFIDCKDCSKKNFKVYEVKLSNNSEDWKNIKLSKSTTYGEVANANKRGQLRGCFYTIFKPQLNENCNLIFDGNISQLT